MTSSLPLDCITKRAWGGTSAISSAIPQLYRCCILTRLQQQQQGGSAAAVVPSHCTASPCTTPLYPAIPFTSLSLLCHLLSSLSPLSLSLSLSLFFGQYVSRLCSAPCTIVVLLLLFILIMCRFINILYLFSSYIVLYAFHSLSELLYPPPLLSFIILNLPYPRVFPILSSAFLPYPL